MIKKIIHYDENGFPYVILSNKHHVYSDYKGRLWYINTGSGYSSIICHYDWINSWACDTPFNKESKIYKEILSLLNRGLKDYLWSVNPKNYNNHGGISND